MRSITGWGSPTRQRTLSPPESPTLTALAVFPSPEGEGLCPPSLGRQVFGRDADLGQRLGPFVVVVVAEQQRLVGLAGQPDALANLVLQLPRPPAGVAERQHRVARLAVVARHRLEH